MLQAVLLQKDASPTTVHANKITICAIGRWSLDENAVLLADVYVKDWCPIPDLVDYQVIDGCQCDCVVSWGPLTQAPAPSPDDEHVALPPLGPSKKAKLIQKLEVISLPIIPFCSMKQAWLQTLPPVKPLLYIILDFRAL